MSRTPIAPILLLLAGCASDLATLPPLPGIVTGVHYRYSDRGSGRSEGLTLTVAGARRLRTSMWILREAPKDGGEALSTRLRFVAALRGNEPILPFSHITTGGRVIEGPAGTALLEGIRNGAHPGAVSLAEATGLLHDGVTTVVSIEPLSELDLVDEGLRTRELDILVGREPDRGYVPGISIRDSGDEGGDQPRQELMVLGVDLDPAGGVLVLTTQVPWQGFEGSWFVVGLSVSSTPEVGADELSACAESLEQEWSRAQMRQRPLDDDERGRRFLARAVAAIEIAEQRRDTLISLAENRNIGLLRDFVLIAGDADLAGFVERVLAGGLMVPKTAGSRAGPDFALERETFRYLNLKLDDGSPHDAILALLLRHAGELGHQRAILASLLDEVADEDELARGLRDENLLMLHSSHPGSRVRAAEWLAGQGVDLGGFEPLGKAEDRRAALSRLHHRFLSEDREGGR